MTLATLWNLACGGPDDHVERGGERWGIRPGAAAGGLLRGKFIICTCILHLMSSMGVLDQD
jgi:hypothetical protein